MGYCPTDCADVDLVTNPSGGCKTKTRKRTISRFGFFSCLLDIPDPITALNIAPLFADGSIVVTSQLANVVLNDPETQQVMIHDCVPPIDEVTRRVINFEDRVAIDIPAVAGSPGTPAIPFHDYDFWKDKKEHSFMLRYMVIYCDGDVKICRDENGNPMEAALNVFLSGDKLPNGGGTLEFKKGSLAFQGDPFDFTKPDFNHITFGINL